jgi:hypothetical protein
VKILFALITLLLLPVCAAIAAPFVISDETAQTVTHCGLFLDAAAKVDTPVASNTTGKYCKFDLAGLSTGAHTIKATFVNIDPVWGRLESVQSVPLSLTKPEIQNAPSGLGLIP